MHAAPSLVTARLRLRPHAPSDFAACCAMWGDPAVTRYIGGKPSTAPQTWQRILAYMGHWQAMTFGYWAVEEAESGTFIGEIGFADFKREIDPRMRSVPEIGFAFASHTHGKGYATEALLAVSAWGDEHLASRRTVALVNAQNAASVHILHKAGYGAFGETLLGDSLVLFLERARRV